MSAIADRIHVLHVDDDPAFLDMAATFLEREDDRITVRTATGTDEGLAMLAEGEVDCIVSDYDIPGRNGIEFLRAVRADHPDLPFILYTGKGSEEVASDAISTGATDYLQKGAGTDQYELLANRIRNAVAQYRSERAQQRLAELAENTNQVLFSFAADWSELLFVNSAYEDIWGRSVADLQEDPTDFLAGVHPEDRDRIREARDVVSGGEPIDIECRVDADEGYGRWVRIRAEPIADETGTVVRIAGFAADITGERRRRERRTRQRETLVELATDDAVTSGDFETAVRRITETAADVLDVPRVNVWLVDEGAETLTCVDHYDRATGEHTRGMELDTDEYPDYFEALETHQAIDAADAHADPRTTELTDYLDAHDVGALLDATLRLEGQTVGVVCHEHVGGPREWADDEVDFASNVADIVHRTLRNRERTVREEELELKNRAMDEAPIGITITDPSRKDNPIVYANRGFSTLTGYRNDEVIGRNHRFLQGEDTDPEAVATMREAIDARERVSVELRNYRKDGTEFWNRVTIAPVTDEDGDLTNFVGFQEDATRRKEREREREATIEFLQHLYEVATDIELDVDEKITRLLAVGPEKLDLPYGTLTRVDVGDGDEGTLTIIEASGDHGLLRPGESCPLSRSYCRETIKRDGLLEVRDAVEAGWGGDPAYETFDLGCYIGTRVTVDDELYGTVFFASARPRTEPFTDAERTFVRLMSKLVGYELERDRAKAELEDRNERLAEFASIVSHDLRSPLNVAEGRLKLAREECDSEHLGAIGRAHDRMRTLVEDLLALAREGENATDLEPVDLAALVEDCWAAVGTTDATLVADVDRTVRADETRLRQVFENLVRNAVEHVGPDVTVTVGELDDGFFVEDDGPGIPPDDREAVFEAGYSTAERGTGYGLRIVERAVEAHGWDLRLTEGTDGGARFEVTGVEFVTGE